MQKRFHHYYLTERLTSKPLRSIYLAHHINDPLQQVVIKVFDATCLSLEQESESLLQKMEWIKQLKHAHIVPVLDLGIEQGQPYVVSTYLSSGSLRHRLDHLSSHSLTLQEALSIVFQVARALRYAHQHNVLHGNIKPENIFFNEQGKALLADFRLADFIDVAKLDYNSDPHTTCYMAPEQFSGTISEKSDQYALACLTYELITGRTPFSAQSSSPMWTKQNTQRAIPLSDLVPNLPEQAEEVVLKAMAKDPSERYANISIFIRALEALSLLPTSVSTNPPLVALASDISVKSMREPVETLATIAPVVARLLERSEYVNSEHNTNKTLDTPPSKASHRPSSRTSHRSSSRASHRPSSKTSDTPPSKTSDLPSSKVMDTPPSKALDLPSSKALDLPSSRVMDTPSSKALDLPSSRVMDTPSSKALDLPSSRVMDTPSSKALDLPSSRVMDTPSSKALDLPSSRVMDTPSSKALVTLTDDIHAESLSKGGLPQPRKPLTPTLWVAFALSGIVILMGTVMLYAFVPSHSPGSSNPGKSSPKAPMTSPNTHVTPTTVAGQSQPSLPPTVETHLTSSYAEQTSNVYNLTSEGTLDWIQWGLNASEDVNHKIDVQQQISSFTLIGTGMVQRDDHYTNAYTWSDGTPVMVAPPQQRSGVYVRGIGNGFTFTVAASTTPRTLKIYVGAAHAQGNFWAGINGRTVTDTSLDMRNNLNVEDNGIYTLTFSSSIPDQVLTVKYTVKASDASNGYVMLEAATLQD